MGTYRITARPILHWCFCTYPIFHRLLFILIAHYLLLTTSFLASSKELRILRVLSPQLIDSIYAQAEVAAELVFGCVTYGDCRDKRHLQGAQYEIEPTAKQRQSPHGTRPKTSSKSYMTNQLMCFIWDDICSACLNQNRLCFVWSDSPIKLLSTFSKISIPFQRRLWGERLLSPHYELFSVCVCGNLSDTSRRVPVDVDTTLIASG